MKTFKISLVAILLVAGLYSEAQSVGIGTLNPSASAALDIQSSQKGLLIPRMTASERISIINPEQGLLVYQTDNDTGFFYYQGQIWRNLAKEFKNDAGTVILYNRILPNDIQEIWKASIDGSVDSKVNILLPGNLKFNLSDGGALRVTPDNKKIIFQVRDTLSNQNFLYSCLIDGSDVKKVIEIPMGVSIDLGCVN